MPKFKSFSEAIKAQRKELKLTAEQLADRVGVDRTYISKIESKGLFPSLQVYSKIAEVLNIKLSDFPADKQIGGKYLDDILGSFKKRIGIQKKDIADREKEFDSAIKRAKLKNVEDKIRDTSRSDRPIRDQIFGDTHEIMFSTELKKYKEYVLLLLEKYNKEQLGNKALKWELVKTLKEMKRAREKYSRQMSTLHSRINQLLLSPAQFEQVFNKARKVEG